MNTITVSASKKYDVIIGAGLLPQIGTYTAALSKAKKAAIISDTNVWPLYGSILEDGLRSAGIEPIHYVFLAGEASKNGDTYLQILGFLAENKLTRSDVLIALGGGVVGDMCGFAAATYLRGIGYIQVPTSLLAMVDSSVGGKTAIDLPAGKNLVGAFYQPSLVLCDICTLDTLPKEIFLDGCAEVIKYGVLYDQNLFEHLMTYGPDFDRESVISRCVAWKRDVVMEDEFDTGARQKLNLGHTIGHGVEAQSKFVVSHGKAVAIGMTIISKAAAAYGICDAATAEKIQAVLTAFALQTHTEYTAAQLYDFALSDKKRSGGTVNLIVPTQIGSCIIRPTPVAELEAFIKAGL